jgi:hypothetical protein
MHNRTPEDPAALLPVNWVKTGPAASLTIESDVA